MIRIPDTTKLPASASTKLMVLEQAHELALASRRFSDTSISKITGKLQVDPENEDADDWKAEVASLEKQRDEQQARERALSDLCITISNWFLYHGKHKIFVQAPKVKV